MQQGQQPRRNRRLGRVEHALLERTIRDLLLVRVLVLRCVVVVGRRFGRLWGNRVVARRQPRRAGRENQASGQFEVRLTDRVAAIQRRIGACRPQRQQRRAQRSDAERKRGRAQNFDLVVLDDHPRQAGARRDDGVGVDPDGCALLSLDIAQRQRLQVEHDRQPVDQGSGRRRIVTLAFVESDHAEPGRRLQRRAVALEAHLAAVHHRRQPSRHLGRQALGHRHQQNAAIAVGQQAALGDRPTCLQRGGQIEPAQQAAVGDVGGHAAHGALAQQALRQGQPPIAHRTGTGMHRHTAQAHRIDGEQRGAALRVAPARSLRVAAGLVGVAHGRHRPTQAAPNSSPSARSTRDDEPASSSTLRRSRWRNAEGATRRN